MSIRAMNAAIVTDAPTDAAKLVMFVLAHHHNHETGACFPSVRRVAKESGLSERGVRLGMAALVEAGLIRKRRATKMGANPFETSNHYELLFLRNAPAEQQDLFAALEAEAAAEAPKGRNTAPRGAERRAANKELKGKESSSLRSEDARAKPKRSHRAAPRRRIDEDWSPGTKERKFAADAGFSDPEIDAMAADFVRFWLSEGETKASWTATWYRWVDKRARAKKELADGQGTQHRSASLGGRGAQRLENLRRFDTAVRRGSGGGG